METILLQPMQVKSPTEECALDTILCSEERDQMVKTHRTFCRQLSWKLLISSLGKIKLKGLDHSWMQIFERMPRV